MIAGAASWAWLKRSRTREAPTPTNISTNSDPDIEKKGTFASPATARARRVLPVPGGPYRSTPFGIFAPISWYFFGSAKKSFISRSSATASSAPATSAKVVFGASFESNFAFDLPKEKIRFPPCEFDMKKSNKNPIRRNGAKLKKSDSRNEVEGTLTFQAFAGGLLVSSSVICGSSFAR